MMKTTFTAFIIRIRFDESGYGLSGGSSVHGVLQQVGSSQLQHFDTIDRLIDLLHTAIVGLELENPDSSTAANSTG